LHNNLSENDIREYVKRRKVSGSTRSELGRQARDTFTRLKKTCRKLGVSFWQYLLDRISKRMAKKASGNQNISCVKKKQNLGYANFVLRDSFALMYPFSVLLRIYKKRR